MKKVLSVLLMLALVFSLCIALASCNGKTGEDAGKESSPAESSSEKESGNETDTKDELKIGFIYLHDQNSTYDRNFMDGAKAACEKLGVTYLEKVPIPEGNECYEAAADLVNQGCSLVFADSFGHEDFLIKAAEEFPDVEFCHATGTQAHTEKLDNFHNAFASIYQGRFLAGIAAGMKLNEMIEDGKFKAEDAKIGYVGAYTYAEVISGYTSFFLGARSVCPTATMEVQFTGSWYDETAEKNAAETLIERGCKLISQHADSMGAPTACEDAGVPDISYNGSTKEACPNTFIVSSRINWEPYFEYIIDCVKNDKPIDVDWTGTLDNESVLLTEVNEKAAAEGTVAAIEEAKEKLSKGEIEVFDVSSFTVTVTDSKNVNATVDGEGHLTGYQADVDTDEAFQGDTEVVENGAFHESKFRSAPYFDIQIDGIELLNMMF